MARHGLCTRLLVIGGLNTAFSAFYYVRVLKVMILDKTLDEVEGREPAPLRLPAGALAFTGVLAAAVIALGVAFNFLMRASEQGVESFAVAAVAVPGARPAVPFRPIDVPRINPRGGQPRGQGQPKAAPKGGR